MSPATSRQADGLLSALVTLAVLSVVYGLASLSFLLTVLL